MHPDVLEPKRGRVQHLRHGSGARAARPRVYLPGPRRHRAVETRKMPDLLARPRAEDRCADIHLRRQPRALPNRARKVRRWIGDGAALHARAARRSQSEARRHLLHGAGQLASPRRHLSGCRPFPRVRLRRFLEAARPGAGAQGARPRRHQGSVRSEDRHDARARVDAAGAGAQRRVFRSAHRTLRCRPS